MEVVERLLMNVYARRNQTLQPTALVNEYLRLVDVEHQQKWNSRGHFFAAAAEAMRRILVENARRKARVKRGGELKVEKVPATPVQTRDSERGERSSLDSDPRASALKQIGLGLHNYHDVYRSFPPSRLARFDEATRFVRHSSSSQSIRLPYRKAGCR